MPIVKPSWSVAFLRLVGIADRQYYGVGAQECATCGHNCDNIIGDRPTFAICANCERSSSSTWIPLGHPEYGHVSIIKLVMIEL